MFVNDFDLFPQRGEICLKSSLQGRELERGGESNKADLEAKSVSEVAKQLGSEAARCDLKAKTKRSEDAKMHSLLRLRKFGLFRKIVDILSLVKRNILISPLEGEKKFLSELCEHRNFREGYKKYKTLDRAMGCAMTCFQDVTNICHRGLCSAIYKKFMPSM